MIFMGTLCLILWKCSKNVGKTETVKLQLNYNTSMYSSNLKNQNKQENITQCKTVCFEKKLTEVLNISRK